LPGIGGGVDFVVGFGGRGRVGKEYEAELVAAGARPVILFVVAFDGKMVKVRKVGG